MQFTPRQFLLLAPLTLVWGINWPIMKLGVTGYPPLAFRAISLWLGLPVLGLLLVAMKTPFKVPRRHWPELLLLAATNMIIWNACITIAVQALTSGRSAILGYTMPVFSAVIGAALFSAVLTRRGWLGVMSCTLGVALLLWHEFTHLAGRPGYVALALVAAAAWALGTQLLRRTRIEVPTLTLSFWMTAITAVAMALLSLTFERAQWGPPGGVTWAAILYNAVLIFGLAQAVWFYLARSLPPVASTLSVMLIPVLGVFSGAVWLNEPVYWQDWTAIVLMTVSIVSVLWPASGPGNAVESRQ
jgi:drug/metabolite transporter (DMT)-like permease